MEAVTMMSKLCLLLGVVFVFISYPQLAAAAAAGVPKAAYTNFIKKSCNTTTYPSICVKSLTPYASTIKTDTLKLCRAALSVAIKGASNATKTVSKLVREKNITAFEAAALRDCIDDMKDAVYELKQTLEAMQHLGDADREFQWANAKTWASAAITDTDSCMDGFKGKKVNPSVKNSIRSSFQSVARYTSNALSLINHLY